MVRYPVLRLGYNKNIFRTISELEFGDVMQWQFCTGTRVLSQNNWKYLSKTTMPDFNNQKL